MLMFTSFASSSIFARWSKLARNHDTAFAIRCILEPDWPIWATRLPIGLRSSRMSLGRNIAFVAEPRLPLPALLLMGAVRNRHPVIDVTVRKEERQNENDRAGSAGIQRADDH